MDDKTYILDPLTSLCKLALLYFMPDGTKLRISNHILYIQEYNLMQGAIRRINGDNRKDLSNLNTPIIKIAKWYILETDERIAYTDDKLFNSINTIASYAIKGLKKAQNTTYAKDISIRIIIQYFINILTDTCNGFLNEEYIVQSSADGSILTDTIKKNFDAHTFNSIAKMLVDADQPHMSTSNINVLIECIHKLLINRDLEFANLMKELNTSI